VTKTFTFKLSNEQTRRMKPTIFAPPTLATRPSTNQSGRQIEKNETETRTPAERVMFNVWVLWLQLLCLE
jgi:hypothetical protein